MRRMLVSMSHPDIGVDDADVGSQCARNWTSLLERRLKRMRWLGDEIRAAGSSGERV